MNTLSTACALALGLALATAAPNALAHAAGQTAAVSGTQAAAAAPELHEAMRSLWHGHIVATRDYALAVHAGNKADAAKAADAVVADAKQIADAVAGFYGKPAGEQMLTLLAGHWGGVKALTDAAHDGNKGGEQHAMNDLAGNAGAIAQFLSGANPNLPDATVRGLLLMHVADHQTQVGQIMSNAPAAEQEKSWAQMQHHMDTIADALADGIARQFPDKAK
ncbi:MAG: hypothetical protein JSS21_01045 [Proteobacteria bacterium]|nr:hypothetical protein [Pseudomonadota bacterium]